MSDELIVDMLYVVVILLDNLFWFKFIVKSCCSKWGCGLLYILFCFKMDISIADISFWGGANPRPPPLQNTHLNSAISISIYHLSVLIYTSLTRWVSGKENYVKAAPPLTTQFERRLSTSQRFSWGPDRQHRGFGALGWGDDDDRSASPLMCTYLPIGRGLSNCDLCLHPTPTLFPFPHHPECRKQSHSYLSLPYGLFFKKRKEEGYLGEEFGCLIRFRSCWHSPHRKLTPHKWCHGQE